jgi:hypothetical protein
MKSAGWTGRATTCTRTSPAAGRGGSISRMVGAHDVKGQTPMTRPGQVRDPSKRGATLLGAGAGIDRCRLFLLTALSESGVAIGTAVASAQITGITIVTGTAPLVGTTALWSLAFGRTGRLVSGHMEETREPARCRARRGECLQ